MRHRPECRPPRCVARWPLAVLLGLVMPPLVVMAQPVFRDPPAVRPPVAPAKSANAALRPGEAVPNLQVEWRMAPDDDGQLPSRAGERVSSTPPALLPTGTSVTQTRHAGDEQPNLPTLRVRNGESVRVALGQWLRRQQVDWVWTPQGGGLQGGTRFDLAQSTLQVQPRWPGGQAPVDLSWSLNLPQVPEADVPPGHWQAEGRLSVPLDTWVRLATLRSATAGAPSVGPAGVQFGTADLAPRPQAVWVRVSRLP